MKAIVRENYGTPEQFNYVEVPKPTPKDHQLLVRVKATSLNMADSIILAGNPKLMRLMGNGVFQPKHKIIGIDFAGIVEGIGKDVKNYQIGDEVFGDLMLDGFGAFGEYACVSEIYVEKKPAQVSFEAVAALPIAAGTALKAVMGTIKIQKGDKVLVNGASGCVGMYVVQLLKLQGAHVTGTCSTEKMAMVKSLGADQVIDYKKTNYINEPVLYDVIIDTAIQRPLKEAMGKLTHQGHYIIIGGNMKQFFKTMISKNFVSKAIQARLHMVDYKTTQEDLKYLANLIKEGKIVTKIDRVYPLAETAAAMTYFQSKKSCGKVVIAI